MTIPPLTLILGGAASGKSAFGEQMVNATGRPKVYLATAQAFDAEMRDKITKHRLDRGAGWTTHEEPIEIAQIIEDQSPDNIVLFDCATLWISNLTLTDLDVEAYTSDLLKALTRCPCPIVVISNEVGAGIVPDNALSRRFRAAQGRLNQRLAAQAGLVVTVMAGLPLVLKGTLPE